ncbi:MAG TPA: EAL domain-containing protein [Steroidobacteraceae bacterium]|jgi:EAL domain-containing protein (putative c-di-GMP-specific phosphodiesterase class I)|nr:EAL domain-containing protein [Steroidobacteraceae bacterium]
MQQSLEKCLPNDAADAGIPTLGVDGRTVAVGPSAASRRVGLATALRRAIADREFVLYYQPQFEVENGAVCGVEALARWFRRDGRMVDTSVFIAAAERSQLIGALGSWVLQEACSTVSQWRSRHMGGQTLCVNVSAQQLDATFAGLIQRVIERLHFPASRLELEITETAPLARSAPAVACLRQVKEMGVRISIDDFGKGGTRFDYLSRLAVDRLKLDRSLISDTDRRWKNVAILRSIIAMARDMGIAVVAEGVETERQFLLLARLGCPQVQGHLLARPAPAETAHEVAARRWGVRSVIAGEARENAQASYAR